MSVANCGTEKISEILLQRMPNGEIKEVRVEICPVHEKVGYEKGVGEFVYVDDNIEDADTCVPRPAGM